MEALAELIILEIEIHGTNPRFPEHRTIRKLIANALTNLTYGAGPQKKRLCSYPGFIPTMVRIFREATNLVQVRFSSPPLNPLIPGVSSLAYPN